MGVGMGVGMGTEEMDDPFCKVYYFWARLVSGLCAMIVGLLGSDGWMDWCLAFTSMVRFGFCLVLPHSRASLYFQDTDFCGCNCLLDSIPYHNTTI